MIEFQLIWTVFQKFQVLLFYALENITFPEFLFLEEVIIFKPC